MPAPVGCEIRAAAAGAVRRTSKARADMSTTDEQVVVGLDNGGTSNNATVLDAGGRFLVDRMVELPRRVLDGPQIAVDALGEASDNSLALTGVSGARVA